MFRSRRFLLVSNKKILSTVRNKTTIKSQFKMEKEIENKEKQIPLGLPGINGESNKEADTTVKLNDLGPVVINADGTVSRVNNWHSMSNIEKETFNRLILKRNKERLSLLKEQENLDK